MIAQAEIAYRGIESSCEDCLWDTFEAALSIASRGKMGKEEYPLYVKGIRELRGHIYAENYTPEIAAGRATKIMYMAVCLLSNTAYQQVTDYTEFLNMTVEQEKLASLRYLKKVNPEAYAYVIKTDRLLAALQG